jgi:hypothetical protein
VAARRCKFNFDREIGNACRAVDSRVLDGVSGLSRYCAEKIHARIFKVAVFENGCGAGASAIGGKFWPVKIATGRFF